MSTPSSSAGAGASTDTADTQAIGAALKARLVVLGGSIARIESALRAPLDADFAEQAAELEGQDALAGIEDGHVAEAQAIHAALDRIADGSYGNCAVCGCDIPAARLAVMPTATRCVGCVE